MSAIDWSAVRARLDELARAAASTRRSPEQHRKILEERARRFTAIPSEAGGDEGAQTLMLEFLVSSERFGIELTYVREVVTLKHLTPVFGAQPFVAGLVPARGDLVTVIDLRRLFNRPATGLMASASVVRLAGGRGDCGLLADSVAGLQWIRTDHLERALPTFAGSDQQYVIGVTPELTAVLDGEALLGRLEAAEDREEPGEHA